MQRRHRQRSATGASTWTTPTAWAIRTQPPSDRPRARAAKLRSKCRTCRGGEAAKGPAWLRRISGRMTATIKTLVIVEAVRLPVLRLRAGLRGRSARAPRARAAFFAGELWQPFTSLFVHLDFVGLRVRRPSVSGSWGRRIEQARGAAAHVGAVLRRGTCWPTSSIAGVWRLRGFGPVPFVDGCSFSRDGVVRGVRADLWPPTGSVLADDLDGPGAIHGADHARPRGGGHHRAARLAPAGGAARSPSSSASSGLRPAG